jgi:hypothetical protein
MVYLVCINWEHKQQLERTIKDNGKMPDRENSTKIDTKYQYEGTVNDIR